MNGSQMFNQMMFVHESVSANFASKLRQFPALHALVFKQRLLPLVRFATSLAEKSRFVTLVCDFCSLTRSRSLASMTSSLPHRFCKTMQTVIKALIELKYNLITEMIANMDLTNESTSKECYTYRLFVRNVVFSDFSMSFQGLVPTTSNESNAKVPRKVPWRMSDLFREINKRRCFSLDKLQK